MLQPDSVLDPLADTRAANTMVGGYLLDQSLRAAADTLRTRAKISHLARD
jgi:hypothetical protein